MAAINKTTIVLWPSEPDAHTIRLHDLTYISDFATDTRISLKGYGTLLAGARFAAASTIRITTTPRLNVISRLAASSTIAVGTQTFLPLQNPLAAQATLHVHARGHLRTTPTLASASALQVSVVPPNLRAPVRFSARSWLQVSTSNPKLSRVPQFFQASAGISLRTNANLVLIGRGATNVLITFNNVEVPNVRLNSIQITDILNEAPNTATFLLDDRAGLGPPAIGTVVRIGLRDMLAQNILFAGTIKQTEQSFEPVPSHPVWQVTCEDFSFLLNRRRVFGTWKNISATQIATDILTRFTAGFSSAGIAANLPVVPSVTFSGESVMDALTQLANTIGGYAGGPDYQRTVWLFLTDPRPNPGPVTPSSPLLQLHPPIRQTLDVSQTRTRVDVKGASVQVGGPPDFNIDSSFGQLPVAESKIFTPGTGGQVLTEDAQIVGYTDVAPGGRATIVRGNVPAPIEAPQAQIAVGRSGGLSGSNYQWKVAFANALGETEVGPASTPPLQANPFPAPGAAFGIGVSPAQVGPLVGTYTYAVSFVTSLGETLVGPTQAITAAPISQPGPPVVQEANAAGPLDVGQRYRYVTSYLTIYGETIPSAETWYTPSAVPGVSLDSFSQWDFGGLENNADYRYGASLVTKFGEGPVSWWPVHTSSYVGVPTGPAILNADFNGRIPPGAYTWAWSYYTDSFGESYLSTQVYGSVGAAPPGVAGARVLLSVPGQSSRANGIRLYRGLQGGNPWQLVADVRQPYSIGSWWDGLAAGGNPWPVSERRNGGVAIQFYVYATSAAEVVARRLYRSKANSTELYLMAELQHNNGVYYYDTAFDGALTVRSPALATTGRAAVVTLPGNPGIPSYTGYVGRRVYRSKANGFTFFRIADVKEMNSTYLTDTTADGSLSSEGPANPSTAGGAALSLQSIPIGPAGTLARRIYRTTANGQEFRRLAELGDNTTTTYLDTTPDSALSASVRPLVNTAGAAAAQLTQIPLGGPSVTQRLLYRTKAGGGAFYYAGSIDNNTDTSFIDDKADTELGRLPVTLSTIGALAGDTSVLVQSAAGWPSSGWFEADSQIIRYGGITAAPFNQGDILTGIPTLLQITSLSRSGTVATATTASAHGFHLGQRVVVLGATEPDYNGTRTVTALVGATGFQYTVAWGSDTAQAPLGKRMWTSYPGAITGAIAGGTTVLSVPMLTGVSGIGVPLPVGSSLNLWIVCDSTAGQQALAALEGGDGVHEYIVTDTTLDSVASGRARGQAELLAFQYVGVTIDYVTRDRLTRSGALVTISMPAPQSISGSFRVQQVRIDQIDIAKRLYPRYTVSCSNTKYSLMDLWRHVVLNHDHAA